MQSIGLKIVGFDFQIDEERQDLQLFKIKQNDSLKNQVVLKPSDNALKKAMDINRINSEDITPIKELSGDIKKAIVIGEVFDNEMRTFKTNNKRFLISICDHTSAIIIAA
jgi:DNA polymerase III alpha subunit (gram-positive type)